MESFILSNESLSLQLCTRALLLVQVSFAEDQGEGIKTTQNLERLYPRSKEWKQTPAKAWNQLSSSFLGFLGEMEGAGRHVAGGLRRKPESRSGPRPSRSLLQRAAEMPPFSLDRSPTFPTPTPPSGTQLPRQGLFLLPRPSEDDASRGGRPRVSGPLGPGCWGFP